MTQKEFKTIIREILHEELLKEASEDKGLIDEKGIITSAHRHIADVLGGKTFVDDEGKTVGEIPKNMNDILKAGTNKDGGRCWIFLLADKLPKNVKASEDLKSAVNKLINFWEKPRTEDDRLTYSADCFMSNSGNHKRCYFELILRPNSGYEIKTWDRKPDIF